MSMLDFKFDKNQLKQMRTFGVDAGILFDTKREFDLMEATQDYKPISPYYKTLLVPKKKQLESASRILDTPLEAQGIHIVSSFPSDVRAKVFALHAFRNALEDSAATARKPRWITLFGDRLDYEKLKSQRPSFVVVTNVVLDSTPYKMERLRDILEMFSGVPRLVVTGGSIDPTELFNKRLYLEFQSALSIGPDNVVHNLLDLLEAQ